MIPLPASLTSDPLIPHELERLREIIMFSHNEDEVREAGVAAISRLFACLQVLRGTEP